MTSHPSALHATYPETGRCTPKCKFPDQPLMCHPPAGTHAALLLFTSLGWQLPLRAHLASQTAAVGLLACFGVAPHCQSKVSKPVLGGGVVTC